MLIAPPTHRQLRNLVADQLRAAILEGRYKPGEWLRQERLAQELGVSQMPVGTRGPEGTGCRGIH